MPDNPSFPALSTTARSFGPGGRPPDGLTKVVLPQPLERTCMSDSLEDARISKKAKDDDPSMDSLNASGSLQTDIPVDSVPDVAMTESRSAHEVSVLPSRTEGFREGLLPDSVSYANMAARNPSSPKKSNESPIFPEDDVVVLEDDYTIDRSGKIPAIKFSSRIHDQIDHNMRNTIIIRLLDRNIGFKTMYGRLLMLWKLIGRFQLIDLEHGYFLVRFEKESDYSMVLTAGPWTIFGCYLTVQPWHRDFCTTEKHPTHVVVWIRLPGLSYRYYSKALFRLIASVVGRVVKIDYNTSGGSRGKFARLAVMVDLNKPLLSCVSIDGHIQKLEYEGLHQICFHCGTYGHSKETCGVLLGADSSTRQDLGPEIKKPSENELYGPWMTVDSRRRRNTSYNHSNKATVPKPQRNNVVMGSRFNALNIDEDVGVDMTVAPESEINNGAGTAEIAAGNFDSQVGLPRPKGKSSKTRGSTSRTQGEGFRRGFSLTKPAELPSRPQPSLHEWMATLSQQLQTASDKERNGADGLVPIPVPNNGHDPPSGSIDFNQSSSPPRVPVDSGDGHGTMEL
ncbi:hypothetical protein GQ457_08G026220 [Hibiscus cannabinus]